MDRKKKLSRVIDIMEGCSCVVFVFAPLLLPLLATIPYGNVYILWHFGQKTQLNAIKCDEISMCHLFNALRISIEHQITIMVIK